MDQLFKLAEKNSTLSRIGSVGGGFRFATRYVDLLIIPWLLDAASLIAYVLARVASIFVPISLSFLERKAAPQLASLSRANVQGPFQAAAARVNLGYLMVCGAVALLVLSLAPHVIGMVSPVDAEFRDILMWLVIGQSAPVLFGATALLMRAVDRGAFYDLMVGVTAALFFVGSLSFGADNGVAIAQTFAAAQLTHSAICALLLTQCGVWPGLTALFHKEIKLF